MEATFDLPAPDIHLPIQNLQPSPALGPCRGHGLPAVPTRTASASAQCPCPLASPQMGSMVWSVLPEEEMRGRFHVVSVEYGKRDAALEA